VAYDGPPGDVLEYFGVADFAGCSAYLNGKRVTQAANEDGDLVGIGHALLQLGRPRTRRSPVSTGSRVRRSPSADRRTTTSSDFRA
jgi:hypothetical protein